MVIFDTACRMTSRMNEMIMRMKLDLKIFMKNYEVMIAKTRSCCILNPCKSYFVEFGKENTYVICRESYSKERRK